MEFLNGTFYAASTFLFLIRPTNKRKILLLSLARFDLANRNDVVKSKKGKNKPNTWKIGQKALETAEIAEFATVAV